MCSFWVTQGDGIGFKKMLVQSHSYYLKLNTAQGVSPQFYDRKEVGL